jgi:hypothetical protein
MMALHQQANASDSLPRLVGRDLRCAAGIALKLGEYGEVAAVVNVPNEKLNLGPSQSIFVMSGVWSSDQRVPNVPTKYQSSAQPIQDI